MSRLVYRKTSWNFQEIENWFERIEKEEKSVALKEKKTSYFEKIASKVTIQSTKKIMIVFQWEKKEIWLEIKTVST